MGNIFQKMPNHRWEITKEETVPATSQDHNALRATKWTGRLFKAVRCRVPGWEPGSLTNAIWTGKEPGSGAGFPKSNSLFEGMFKEARCAFWCVWNEGQVSLKATHKEIDNRNVLSPTGDRGNVRTVWSACQKEATCLKLSPQLPDETTIAIFWTTRCGAKTLVRRAALGLIQAQNQDVGQGGQTWKSILWPCGG